MPMQLAHLSHNFNNIFSGCPEPIFATNEPSTSGGGSCWHPRPVHSEPLDPAVWGQMPESLLYRVFSQLPIKSMIRLRCLNKHWMSTDLLSSCAHRECEHPARPARFAIVRGGSQLPCDQHEAWVFDTPAQEWCKLRIGCFPTTSEVKGPFAAAGGLLCYASERGHDSTLQLLVCNPLTQTWRYLPPNLELSELPTLAHMSIDSHSQYCIILVAMCENSGALVIEVFDSKMSTWSNSDIPSQLASYYNLFQGDDYKGLATIDTKMRSMKRLMYPYALQQSSFLDPYEDKCWILESKGSLFMCSNASQKEGIWQRLEHEWSKVCSYPKILQKYEKISLFLSDDVVLLLGAEPFCFPPQFEDVDPHQLVLYHKVTHEWSVLPRISSKLGVIDEIMEGFMFEPRFDTKP